MSFLALLTGIMLAWLAGALAVRSVGGTTGASGDWLRAAGFGLFIGLALAAWALRATAAIAGGFSWWPVAAVLLLVTALAVWRLRRIPAPSSVPPSRQPAVSWIVVLVLAAATLHALFAGLELVTQPVFPWDGWTVWVYRAKAWFHAAELAPIVSESEWLAAESARVFTTPAANYPLLPSLVTLWAALSLGDWHEALVNLPVLAAGLAIAAGLAGCLRGAGVGVLGAAIAVYLLVSTPLFGVHMSLGGYADIWLAGYAGLGMTALLWGLATGHRTGIVVGLVLLTLGVGVKAEGLTWLATGLLVLALTTAPWRMLAAAAGLALLLGAAALVTGWTLFEIPGVGPVGFDDGALYVPFKGPIRLEAMDVAPAYLANAFLMGNWHLLWVLVLATLVVLIPRAASPLGRAGLAFLGTFVTLQAVVFGMTSEGAWARDYTAINRMPLHMLPALLFLVVLAGSRAVAGVTDQFDGARMRRSLWIAGTAAVLLGVAGLFGWLARDAAPNAAPRTLDADSLRFVAGGGDRGDQSLTIDRFQGGLALLSSGPVDIDATAYPILSATFEARLDPALPERAPAFFWRRADQVREVSRITLVTSGPVDLAASPDWRGRIVEAGFFFPEAGGAVRFEGATLETDSVAKRFALLLSDWTRFEPWTQQSAHFLHGGSAGQAVSLTALVAATALLAALFGTLLLGRSGAPPAFAILLLAGWATLDARWGWDRFRQAQLSYAELTTTTMADRQAKGEPGVYFGFLQRLLERHLDEPPRRVLVVTDPAIHRYYGLRAKYQLLPYSTHTVPRMPPAARLPAVDYVLFLGPFTGTSGQPPERDSAAQRRRRLGLAGRQELRNRLEPVVQDPQGTLYRVR